MKKNNKLLLNCKNCGKFITKKSASIIIVKTYDGNHFYQKTKRKFINYDKFVLCKKCFLKYKNIIIKLKLNNIK